MRIALGSARGLAYLHEDCMFMSCRILLINIIFLVLVRKIPDKYLNLLKFLSWQVIPRSYIVISRPPIFLLMIILMQRWSTQFCISVCMVCTSMWICFLVLLVRHAFLLSTMIYFKKQELYSRGECLAARDSHHK